MPTRTFIGSGGSFSVSVIRSIGGPPGNVRCPGFSLLAPDHVGSVALPRGQYAVRPGGEEALTCLAAAQLIVRIVDGRAGQLPGSWAARRAAGADPGVLLSDSRGRRLLLRRVDGATAGGGHTSP